MVVSTASWAPFHRGKPLAMTSMRLSSRRSTGAFRSRTRVLVVFSRQTRAAARSRGQPQGTGPGASCTMVAKRVEKAIAPAAAGGKGQRQAQAPQQKHAAEQRRRVGKLRAARHAGENPAAVGACLRKQGCLRSRDCLGEDLTLKLPGNSLAATREGWGRRGPRREQKVGDRFRAAGAPPTRAPQTPPRSVGCAQAGGHGSFGRAPGRRPAASEGRRPPSRALDCGGPATHQPMNPKTRRGQGTQHCASRGHLRSCARRAAVSGKGAALKEIGQAKQHRLFVRGPKSSRQARGQRAKDVATARGSAKQE